MAGPAAELKAPLPVLTSEEMRAWEARCFAPGALSERVVMESAGRAAALAVVREFGDGPVIGFLGRGNNGGDGVVALRTLRALGRDVGAVLVGGAEAAAELVHGWDIPIIEDARSALATAGCVIDGILGTGASGPPREPQAEAIRIINAAGRPVVALDGPTGVNLTTGRVRGEAIRADLTVTFGALKRGLLLQPGRSFAGRILLAEVGFPPVPPEAGSAAAIDDGWARAHLPEIRPDAHKTGVGVVAVAAGRTGFGGACIMATMGALRAGSGGVRVVSSESNRVAVHSAVPEAVFINRTDPGMLAALEGTRAAVVGPGIGTDDEARAFLVSFLGHYDRPLVLDADALTLIASDPTLLPAGRGATVVMTPHPGELARLLGVDTAVVLEDRIAAARTVAERFGTVVLAKGAPSVVVGGDGPVLIGVSGHSGVATGGMGDTLAGVIAALLAMGSPPRDAAALGLHLAGRAAEAAGRGRGLLPRDVAEAIPGVIETGFAAPRPEPPFLLDLPAAH